MMRRLIAGVAAGAAATAGLNAVTYLDMALRGRAASQVPAKVAAELLAKAGVAVGNGESAENRQSATGALMGYAAGLGVGGLYGLLRTVAGDVPLPLAVASLSLAAMAAGDAPAIALGQSNPKQWGLSGWLSDIIPHAAYGAVAAATYEICSGRRGNQLRFGGRRRRLAGLH